MYKNGSDFLNKLYSNMHMEDVVMHTAEKSDTPDEKISRYLDRLERVHNMAKDDKHKMDLLKEFYYKKYVIKELPESYVDFQKKIAREEGHGDIDVTDDMRKELLKNIQNDQKKSLDSWIEYLSSDDAMYPMWFKNYAFQGMLKLSNFDKEKREFGKRTTTTTNPYIELNREVLAQVYNTLANEVGNNELTDEQVKALENGISFKKLYTYYLTKQNYVEDHNKSNDGIWVKYDQGSDSKILCDTLQGKNTGWCTAGYETAKAQLKNGDFYIYYTKGSEGKYTEPRIAIRMNGHDEIGEVRGVASDQNLEGEMTDIADKKLDEFPDKDKYKKKVHDMKLLTKIDNKVCSNETLTREELKFLHEIDYEIEGFGWERDTRIEEIKEKRNIKKDFAYIFGCTEKEIATNQTEYNQARKNGIDIKCYCGTLNIDGYDVATTKGITLPENIIGYLNLIDITTTEGITIPKNAGLLIRFIKLKTAKGINLPEQIGGSLMFQDLEIAEGLKLPSQIDGSLYLYRLTTIKGLKLPESIGGDLCLGYLTTAKGLTLPESIKGDLHLSELETAEGLKLPESVGGNLWLNSLTTAKGLTLPKMIGEDLRLLSLTTAKGLIVPKYIEGDLILPVGGLATDEIVILPESYRNKVGCTKAKITYIPDEEYFKEDNLSDMLDNNVDENDEDRKLK